MAQNDDIKARMTKALSDAMVAAATRRALAQVEDIIAYRETWYDGEISVDFINGTVAETYGKYANA
jgi:hypothetical protein